MKSTYAKEKVAQAILGNYFITPAEVIAKRQPMLRVTPLVYTPEQLKFLQTTLPPLKVLVWYRDNNFGLVPLPPRKLNLPGICELNPSLFYTHTSDWYIELSRNEAVEITNTGWLAIRKDAVPNLTHNTYEQECSLLSPEERVPQAVQVAWFDMLFAEVRNVHLLPDVWVWTSSVTTGGFRVYVRCSSNRFDIGSNASGGMVHSDLGVLVCR